MSVRGEETALRTEGPMERRAPTLRRLPRSILVVVLAAGLLAATAGAARIVGTARGDVLRGTAKADRIDGRGGNDTVYGLAGNDSLVGGPGNDTLVGGPGRDTLTCGPGRDTARAGTGDTVSSSCERVSGLPPAPEPPPPEPPAPPTPPPALTPPGMYCGFTSNGQSMCFEVTADGRAVTNARFAIVTDCQPASRFRITFSATGTYSIADDRTFAANTPTWSHIRGRFDGAGNASGLLHINEAIDYEGTRYTCLFDTEWTVKRQ